MLYNMLGALAYGVGIVSIAKLFVGNYQVTIPYLRWIGVAFVV